MKITTLLIGVSVLMSAFDGNGATIIAFGDSITLGYGSETGGFPPKLASLLAQHCKPSVVINAGVGGEQTPEGVGRLDSLLTSLPADFILIMEGTNDVNSGISLETTRFNLKAMIDKSNAAGITPLLATLTPSNRGSSEMLISQLWNPMIKALTNSQGVKLVDQYIAIIPTWWISTVDGLHPNDNGYQTIAYTWCMAIGSNDLRDALFALQIAGGRMSAYEPPLLTDINNDNRIGLAETICRLQSISGKK